MAPLGVLVENSFSHCFRFCGRSWGKNFLGLRWSGPSFCLCWSAAILRCVWWSEQCLVRLFSQDDPEKSLFWRWFCCRAAAITNNYQSLVLTRCLAFWDIECGKIIITSLKTSSVPAAFLLSWGWQRSTQAGWFWGFEKPNQKPKSWKGPISTRRKHLHHRKHRIFKSLPSSKRTHNSPEEESPLQSHAKAKLEPSLFSAPNQVVWWRLDRRALDGLECIGWPPMQRGPWEEAERVDGRWSDCFSQTRKDQERWRRGQEVVFLCFFCFTKMRSQSQNWGVFL